MERLIDLEVNAPLLVESREPPRHAPSGSAGRLSDALSGTSARRIQRRLAAIMAADVVGYSRLMGRDEEGAVHRLREFQAAIGWIIEANAGRIANTAGDAMLVEFPSSVAALDSALAIQEVVGLLNRGVDGEDEMLLRIGVNVGEVIIEGGDVFGEVVNVASRLEAIVEPGGICFSHACYVQTERQFAVHFTDLGELRRKNIAEPVRACAVRPLWADAGRPNPSGPQIPDSHLKSPARETRRTATCLRPNPSRKALTNIKSTRGTSRRGLGGDRASEKRA
jgi:class 3 adenylate cyclase